MLKLNKFVSIFLFIFVIAFCKSQVDQLPNSSIPNSSMPDSSVLDLSGLNSQEQDLSELQDFLGSLDEGSFANFNDGSFSDVFKSPDQMAENLPNELRDEVLSIWEQSGEVSNKIMNPMVSVLDICSYLSENLPQVELKNLIVKIRDFLISEQFAKNIRVNFSEIKCLDFKEKENFYLELDNLKTSLDQNIEKYKVGLDKEKSKSLMVLNNVILSFRKCDSQLFFDIINNFEKKKRINVRDLFNSILKKLDDALIQEQSEDSKESLLFFKNDILGGLKPSINSIKDDGSLDKITLKFVPLGALSEPLLKIIRFADKTSNLNKSLLFSYSFYKKFLNYYLLDNGYNLKFFFGDKLINNVFLPIFILKKVADLRIIAQNKSNEEIAVAAKDAFGEIWRFYSDSNYMINKSSWPVRSIYRIVSSLAYYNFWYKDHQILTMLEKGSDIDLLDALNHKLLSHEKRENYKYWPKEFKHLKNAIWFSIKDGYLSLGNVLQHTIYANVNSKKLNKIENNSLGLIKPELINFTLNTFMPVLAENYFPENIINLEKTNIFASDKKPALSFIKREKHNKGMGMFSFSLGYMANKDYINYVGNPSLDKIPSNQYIQNRFLGYMAVNMGSHFGKKFGYNLRNKFDYLGGKIIVNLIEKLGFDFNQSIKILSQQDEDFKKLSECQKKLNVLKEFIKQQIPAIFAFAAMAEIQTLQESKEINPFLQARNMFFAWLVNEGIFTQAQILEIDNEFNNTGSISVEKLDLISNAILDKIKGAIAKKIGGFVGALSSWKIADMLVKKYTIEPSLNLRLLDEVFEEDSSSIELSD